MRHTIKHGNIAGHPVLRVVFMVLGVIFALLALSGLVLPFMPGLIFLIISTYFFARSSEKFHQWLLNNKYFGHHLTAFAHGAKLPMYIKIFTILTIIVSVTVGIIYLRK